MSSGSRSPKAGPLPPRRAENAGSPRVVLADDHAEVLQAICSLLETDFQVVSTANEGRGLLERVLESRPDGVVADVQMSGMTGIEAGREIISRGLCHAVVMLSMYDDPQLIQRAMTAGIRGYVLKEDAGEELIPALRTVLAGGRYLSRGASAAGFR